MSETIRRLRTRNWKLTEVGLGLVIILSVFCFEVNFLGPDVLLVSAIQAVVEFIVLFVFWVFDLLKSR